KRVLVVICQRERSRTFILRFDLTVLQKTRPDTSTINTNSNISMRRIMRMLVFFCLVLSASLNVTSSAQACDSLSLAKVLPGMGAKEVVEILGEPKNRSHHDGFIQ